MTIYRGKRKYNGEWCDVSYWKSETTGRSFEVIPETIGMQTGQKDSNRQPIRNNKGAKMNIDRSNPVQDEINQLEREILRLKKANKKLRAAKKELLKSIRVVMIKDGEQNE